MQVKGEGTSSKSIQASLGSPMEARAEPVSRVGQTDPATSFPVGAKTRPMTRFVNKQGPSI